MIDQRPSRLPLPWGRLLHRERPLTFTFEGERFDGYGGDTVTSALLGHGRWLLGRSLKYHRPRGPFTLTGDDANTLLQRGDEPNVPAEHVPVEQGLAVAGQHYTGSLQRDRARINERFSRFLFVGFYYRAFYKPRGMWDRWEPMIRRAAGLGHVNTSAGQHYYDKQYDFCDVAVVGAGVAGLTAALNAAEAGADTVLIEREPILGGGLNYHRFDTEGTAATHEREALVARVQGHDHIRIRTATQCTGRFGDNLLALVHGRRMTKLRAGQVVAATGAIGQPAVFRYNDLPGIATGSGVQRLMRLHGVRPGRRAVCVTSNGDGYGVALDLLEAGVEVAAVVDLRRNAAADERTDAVRGRGVPVHTNAGIVHAVEHGQRVAGLRISERDTGGNAGTELTCDLVTVDVGATPAISLIAHAGGDVSYSETNHGLSIRDLPPRMHAAGAVAGPCSLEAARREGAAAGRLAAEGNEAVVPDVAGRDGPANDPWPIFPHPKGKEFVDFDEDLTVADLRNAVAEGFDSIELVKRFSTVGMGPSQGRTAAVNAVRIVADTLGQSVEGARASTNRPPAIPEKYGHIAGRSFDPIRLTSMHRCHVDAGAKTMVAGAWLRPAYYQGSGSDARAAITAEIRGVRENVGLIDVSTLGGIEIRGDDAAEFLNRMYTFGYKKQPTGRGRYLLMTDDTGAIVDDGVSARFADDHYYITATTGGADNVYRRMLWWNAQWRLDVDIANVTAAYAGVNIAGPNARRVLEQLETNIDFSADAFPYLEVRGGDLGGIPVRAMRVGFVGELGYELHCPAGCGEALWEMLMAAGREFAIGPFGVEAQRVLRLEKGHIIVGQDTDNLTHPTEAGMDWAVSRRKPFFVGAPAIAAREAQTPERRSVGFRLPPGTDPLPEENHLVIDGQRIAGRVTSIAWSPTLGHPIGLAFVPPERARPGATFTIKAGGGRMLTAEVVPIPFHDPENERQNR